MQAADAPTPAPATAELPAFNEGANEALIERADQAQSREYDSVLASLDDFMKAHPQDAAVAVERCRFVAHFASLEDAPIESAVDRSEECNKDLETAVFPNDAPVELYLLENLWGDEAKSRGLTLLSPRSSGSRSGGHACTSKMADLYSATDVMKAGPYALTALRLNPQSSVRLVAAEYLIRIGSKAAALRMIQEMPKESWNAWSLSIAVKLLIGMDAVDAANTLVEADQTFTPNMNTRVLLARSLFSRGEVKAAHRVVKEASEEATRQKQYGTAPLRELFELERDFGSTDDATAAYRRLRSLGFSADPFGRHRLSLSLAHPRAPWRWEDALGIGAFILFLGALALLPLLVIAPIHYRSVVKQLPRTAPLPPSPVAPWTLGQMWYALAVLLVAGMAAFYFMDYSVLHRALAAGMDLHDSYDGLSSDRALGNALLLSSAVIAIALLPLVMQANPRSLFLGTWSVRRSLLTGIGAAFALFILTAFLGGMISGPLRRPRHSERTLHVPCRASTELWRGRDAAVRGRADPIHRGVRVSRCAASDNSAARCVLGGRALAGDAVHALARRCAFLAHHLRSGASGCVARSP